MRMLIVPVPASAKVPSKQVTVPPASEHVPTFVLTERYETFAGSGSVTITLVALAGPLFVTLRGYTPRDLRQRRVQVGTGVSSLLTMVTLALLEFATTTDAVALFTAKIWNDIGSGARIRFRDRGAGGGA